ncbi:hypothetical protein ELS19_19130 [Halogeometricum borinquense]|uniref:Uncharacterized protein n=1 Tax=Halogeometricum borinquense TaxID=60847 RepID=A0A482T6S9_9EURY|nr:hypothetical protein [Halogeometricum borinquense]RYJ08607.1 hypothetical protein ELS19_19130 [Halogeometricum borinquense]
MALASTVGLSGVAAAKSKNSNGFDPDKQSEVNEFVRELHEAKKPKKRFKKLSEDQKQAVIDVLTDITWKYESNISMKSQSSAQSGWKHKPTVKTTAYGDTAASTREYSFTQELTWEYNGDTYRNVEQDYDYSLGGVFADWDGIKKKTTDESSDRFFTAEIQGKFSLDVGVDIKNVVATIESRGNASGVHTVLEKDAPA